jgi:hypothetical protein
MKYLGKIITVYILLTNSLISQVNSYTLTESIQTYLPIDVATSFVAYASPWDNNVANAAFQASIGFDFEFDGVVQNQCFISPNGFITFGNQLGATVYVPLSSGTNLGNGGAISALGVDLISTTDDIIYTTIGTSPNREFVVQWTNAARKSAAGNLNFQIRLLESSNAVQFSYGDFQPMGTSAINVQVGIRGNTNVFAQGNIKNRLQNGTNVGSEWFLKSIDGTANSSTMRTSETEYPNNGLVYTFTPSNDCTTPSGIPSSLVIGATNVTANAFTGNSFMPASPAPSRYLVLRSISNEPPTSADVVDRTFYATNNVISSLYTVVSVNSATTFTQTGLQPNTTYYYWVIPYNTNCLGGPKYNLFNMITASKTTCVAAPTGLSAVSIAGNGFTISWNSVVNASDYEVFVSTTSNFSSILPNYNGVSTDGLTTFTTEGLNSVTNYFVRIRAVGSTCAFNSSTLTIRTICGYYTIPYFQTFDTTPIATIPTCSVITDENLDGTVWEVKNTQSASNPNALHISTNTSNTSDDWFYMPGLQMNAGLTYRLRFKYKTLSDGQFLENLRVRIGSGSTVNDMNLTLVNLSSISNTVYQTALVDFPIYIDNVYYIGFQAYSFLNQSSIILDDISVIVSPTCFEPSSLTVNSVGVTTATISWQEAFPEPQEGYQYYVSTSNIMPSSTVIPSGSVAAGVTSITITNLSAATLYYVWVRGNCSPTDQSIWSLIQTFSTDCDVPSFIPVVGGTMCGGGTVELSAASSSGGIIEWFSDSNATNLIATGDTFTTPNLSTTTTYYAQSKVLGGLISVGPASPYTHGGGMGSDNSSHFINFAITSSTELISIDIYPMVANQPGTITIKDNFNSLVGTLNYITNVGGGNTAQTINIGLQLEPGNYIFNMEDVPTGGLMVNVDSADYPYTSSVGRVFGNSFDNTYYLYAYNWKFSNICRSLPTPVQATVTAAPAMTISNTDFSLCYGESTSLITLTGQSAYDIVQWQPDTAIAGNEYTGYILNPTETTQYVLTAQQSSGSMCMRSFVVDVVVKPEPPAVTVIPNEPQICEGAIQLLSASLPTSTPVVVFEENFNAPTNDWVKINQSSGGIVSNASWILRESPYTYLSGYWVNNNVFTSNDNSQFYFSNSDAQGGPAGNRTLTILESPSFNLVGYTTATLNYYQFLRFLGGNRARVEASIDNGATWILLRSYNFSFGSASNFAEMTVDMSSLVGNPSVKIRFYYDALWSYGWALDNVKITANLAVEVAWSPAESLYFDSEASEPYIQGTPASTVYAKPSLTTLYTGTAVGSNGCYSYGGTTITVAEKPEAGLLSESQIVCANWNPIDLVLTGYSHDIVGWQYATDANFTSGLTAISNTTDTLVGADLGSFAGTRYYRALLQNGTCPVEPSNVVSVSKPVTAWDGTSWSNGLPNNATRVIFNGNFISTGNINACSVEVINGTVVFNANHNLVVQNDVKVTNGTLRFLNNASLVQINNDDNTGTQFENQGAIQYHRSSTPVYKYDYTYWSSPVYPQLLNVFSPGSSLFYTYNPVTQNWHHANISLPMKKGKGYIIRTPDTEPFSVNTSTVFEGVFDGIPNTGTVRTPIVGSNEPYNLIGNPYPSAIDANLFLSDANNRNVIDGTLYFWTHNTAITNNAYTSDDYAMYNYSGGVGTGTMALNNSPNNSVPNGKIAAGQSFFVQGKANGEALFTNNMRVLGNNNQFFRSESNVIEDVEKHRFWLDIASENGDYKQLLVAYIEGATHSYDRGFDGLFYDGGTNVSMYVLQDDLKLSIQGRALTFADTDVIPLGISAENSGFYTVSMPLFDGLFATQDVYLHDKLLGITHNLKQSSYTFSTTAGINLERFEVVFRSTDLGVKPFDTNTLVVYLTPDKNFVVDAGVHVLDKVQVYDVRGRLLQTYTAINHHEIEIDGGVTNGVLLLSITNTEGKTVVKKVVR